MTALAAQTRRGPSAEQPADVLVVFGITGDLARVMTFRSLYRLEKGGLLSFPIAGSWGPEAAGALVAEHGSWRDPWVQS